MPHSISVFGLGYVGCVSAACFAHLGHQVTAFDIVRSKIDTLESGRSPIVEARMDELVADGRAVQRLRGARDCRTAIHESDISFICVGTPSHRNGKPDLSHIIHVCGEIGPVLAEKKKHHTIVLRSTVLPGTTESLVIKELERASGLSAGEGFSVFYNPEFMREGSAASDFFDPPCNVFGSNDGDHSLLHQLYEGIPGPRFDTTIPVAEMTKYVANAFHALKVSFANEIGSLCKALDVDTEHVAKIFASDTKLNISPAYLSPGLAFGGSCLPKDLRALTHSAKALDLCLPLLDSISHSNDRHLERATEMILQTGKSRIAVLGLSFKAATDDLRESPQVRLIKCLLGEGRKVRIWDQNVVLGRLLGSNRRYIEEVIPHIGSLLFSELEESLEDAEVVVIATRELKSDVLKTKLQKQQIVIDLVNLERQRRPDGSFSYQGICW